MVLSSVTATTFCLTIFTCTFVQHISVFPHVRVDLNSSVSLTGIFTENMFVIPLAFFAFGIFYLMYVSARKPRNFPKGPVWLPVIGSALSVDKSRKETGMLIKGIAKIADSYPMAKDVVGIKVGKDKVVFVRSTEATMEFFLNPDLDGRPYGPLYETRTWNLRRGIVLTDGGS
jgi:hypothetical protein